jgi:hypothetical protein
MTYRFCEFCKEWTAAENCPECGAVTLPAENPRERGDDDAVEFSDPRDRRDERRFD